MRITHQMLADITVSNLRQNVARLEALQNAITTGQRHSRPSDDPPAVTRTLTYTSDIAAGEAYLRTIDSSLTWLNATDDALSSGGQLLQRARELAVQGANGGLNASDMASIGAEVDHLLKQLVVTGNASMRGQRLFAGEKINADPFALAGGPTGYAYTGDTGQMMREYDLGATLAINTPGQATFGPAITALTNLRNNLNAGNNGAISSGDLMAIDGAMDTLLAARSQVGAKTNRLEAAQERQSLLQINLQALRSKSADTDYVDAVSKFSVQETVYKASLEVGERRSSRACWTTCDDSDDDTREAHDRRPGPRAMARWRRCTCPTRSS